MWQDAPVPTAPVRPPAELVAHPERARTWRPGWPLDLALTLEPLAHGRRDPTIRITPEGAWWATRTSSGPVTLHLCRGPARSGPEVRFRAWGPGATEALDELPGILGDTDDPAGFPAAAHPVMAAAHARFGAGWRLLRTRRTLDSLIPAVLEQRVTGLEAARAWRTLVSRFGEPAPGAGQVPGCPADLRVPPDAPRWREVPSWAWHAAGVDPGRAATALRVVQRAGAVERLAEQPAAQAAAALSSIPGVGGWTTAEVAVRAWGDPDAVSFGDYHLAGTVVHALTGRRRGTDAQLAELLEPWSGQRARAVRLLLLHCGNLPRRGPRAAVTDHRRH